MTLLMWAKLNGALAGSILPIIFCLVYDVPRGIFGLNPFSFVYLIGIYVACYVYVKTEKKGPTAKGCGETAALMAVVNGLFLSVVALFSVTHGVGTLFKVLYSYVPLLIIFGVLVVSAVCFLIGYMFGKLFFRKDIEKSWKGDMRGKEEGEDEW